MAALGFVGSHTVASVIGSILNAAVATKLSFLFLQLLLMLRLSLVTWFSFELPILLVLLWVVACLSVIPGLDPAPLTIVNGTTLVLG